MKYPRALFTLLAIVLFATTSPLFAQKRKPAAAKTAKPIIFGVLDDGVNLEPIAYVEKGKLIAPANGGDEGSIISAFVKTYYKVGTSYRLIFGGADAGTVKIKSANAASDCAKNMATISVASTKVKLKGFVMGLATNATGKGTNSGLRRKPTQPEKNEIDALVKAEYAKNKLTPKVLRYQNLTAIDVDGDGKYEMVGSYWVEVDKLTRALLFFIADKHSNGKYGIDYSEYRSVDQQGTMSGDLKDVDQGIYHELLLDYFDVDGDGTGEIFTNVQSFEGSEFNVYKRNGTKWTRIYDFSNYHCGY